MTAWTEAEKANLRAYLGFPSLFANYEPRLENAITAVQSTADGGALSSSATQDRMRSVLTQLATLESKMTELQCSYSIMEAGTDNVKLDAGRALFLLRMEGRRLIGQLSISLGTRPIRDYFTGVPIRSDADGQGSWSGSPFGYFDG